MDCRSIWKNLWLLLLAFCCCVPGPAQSFPDKPVSILVSVAPGSAPDVIARILADQLTQHWKQQVLVVNRPGGTGSVAAQAAALANPDGYTLHMALSSAFAIFPESKTKWPVDLATDFTTVGLVADQPMAIAVSPKLNVNTLPEFIELAKRRPNELLFGSSRLSIPHMTGELLNLRAGIKLRYVPTIGAAKVIQDIMGGTLHVYVDSVSGAGGALQSGELKGLALASDKRLDSYPNLPLASDTLPNFHAKGWFVLMAPVKTPEAVVTKLREDLRTVLGMSELRRRFEGLGTFPKPSTLEQTLAFIKTEQDQWRPIVRQIGTD